MNPFARIIKNLLESVYNALVKLEKITNFYTVNGTITIKLNSRFGHRQGETYSCS